MHRQSATGNVTHCDRHSEEGMGLAGVHCHRPRRDHGRLRLGAAPRDKQQVVLDPGLRRTYRRSSFALARLLANMGVAAPTPLLARFRSPVSAAGAEQRWRDAFYLDQPEDWDYPYRFFCW